MATLPINFSLLSIQNFQADWCTQLSEVVWNQPIRLELLTSFLSAICTKQLMDDEQTDAETRESGGERDK